MRSVNETRTEVLIVGAGPAGLAVAACLRREGVAFEVLEQAGSVGPRWREHYERLHLHTFRDTSALPHQPWPAGVPGYPSRQQVVDYLESYARRFEIAPRFSREVRRLAPRSGGGWVAEARGPEGEERWLARHLVVAAGYNREPYHPRFAGDDGFEGAIVHSRAYREGRGWRGKRALVVGAGNSGAEIALDLFEHGAETAMCVRSPTHVSPRDLFGFFPAQLAGLAMSWLPARVADRVALPLTKRLMGDLSAFGITRPALGPLEVLAREGRVALLDIGTVELIRQGRVTVYPGIARFDAREVAFVDGRRAAFDLVVLATGYRPALSGFFDGAAGGSRLADAILDERGYPRVFGAEVPGAPGLYFIGYSNPPTGALFTIAREAKRVAKGIARVSAAPSEVRA